MNTVGTDEFSEILNRVNRWPHSSRITLARRILESLDPPAVGEAGPEANVETPTRGVPVELAIGLLRTDAEPPNDEECRRIVEEERWKKYGP